MAFLKMMEIELDLCLCEIPSYDKHDLRFLSLLITCPSLTTNEPANDHLDASTIAHVLPSQKVECCTHNWPLSYLPLQHV